MKSNNMKKVYYNMVWLLCVVLVFAACEKRDPDFFDEGANGAYFDYEYATDFDMELNFAEHIVGNPDTVSMMLNVKLLGYLMEEGRTLAVKTKEIAGCELADVTIDEVVFANKEYEKEIEVKVKRPEVEDIIYGVCIYLDGSGDIGAGITGKDSINLFVTESYEMPLVWYSHMDTYLGTWSKEKHIFLANHTGDNHFYNSLYDENSGQHLFTPIINLSVSAVNALLANESAEPIMVEFPILQESDYPAYQEPYFWKEYKDILGVFRANKFCRFTAMMGGANTTNVAVLYASGVEEKAEDFHKIDVAEMLNEYYKYAKLGYPIAEYKNLYWVEMKNNLTYTMRIPYWWEDSDRLGAGDIVKKYFGEYNDYKYQFMLTTMMAAEGSENFIAASILPFIYNKENNTFAWDESPLGINSFAGEERLKECYRIIKAKYDKLPNSKKNNVGVIPDVEL